MKKILILFAFCIFCTFGLTACELEAPKETHTHIYSQATLEKMPTCTEKGKIRFMCECGDTYYAEFKTTGHTYTETVVNPTCTEKGYTLHKCACGDEYTDNETPAFGHNFGEWVITKEPTCTETGIEKRICSRDETHTEMREVPATGHDYEWTTTKEPTETEDGIKTGVCKNCGDTITETLPVLNHEHNYVETVVEPTCTTDGYTLYKCACGDEYMDNETPALGHTPLEAVEENRIKPTCTEEGAYESVVYCAICSTEITRETILLDKTAHNYEIDETTTQKVSDNLYEFNVVCKDCDKSIFVGAVKSKTVAPTCCEQGYSEYLYFYKAGDEIVSDTVNLDFTEPTLHLHTLGYDENGEPLQFKAYGLSDNNKTYVITPLIQEFLDSGELKLNGGHMTGNTQLATFDCVHCHKLIVIRLEKEND